MGAESFTVLAILEARDRASEIFAKVDESLDKFSDTAKEAADSARAAGDSIDDSLLKTASGADALDVATARVDAISEKATRTAEAQAEAEKALLEAHKAAAGAADDDVAAQYRLMEANEKLAATSKENAAAQKDLAAAQKTAAAADTEAVAAAKAQADAEKAAADDHAASAASLSKLGKIAGIAALGLGVAGAVMVKAAGNFQDSTTHLVTDAGESQKNLGMVQAGILKVSTATGQSAESITAAMYHVESSGFHAASGLAILKTVAEGARVGGADLDDTSKALVGTLTAYYGTSLKAGQATKLSTSLMNQMIATVGSGDMRMSDLASSLSTVTPVAASAGLSFSQVGGAIATMTAQGMTAQQATQDLANTIRNLKSPNNVASSEMRALGLNANDVSKNLGKTGLAGTLGELRDAVLRNTQGGSVMLGYLKEMSPAAQSLANQIMAGKISTGALTTAVKGLNPEQAKLVTMFKTAATSATGLKQTYTGAMAKMLGGSTGLNTALMLTGKHMSDLTKNTNAIAAAGKKASGNVSGWSTIQGTFNFKLAAAKTAVENTGIAIGSALLPAATALLGLIVRVVTPIVEWTSKHRILTLVIFGGVTALAALVAVITLTVKAFNAVKGAVDSVKTALSAVSKLFRKAGDDAKASADVQEEASGEAAAAQEGDAAEVAAANETAAAESEGSWATAAAGQIASAAKWVGQTAAQTASAAASYASSAAQAVGSWIKTGAQMVARVATTVAANVAGAAASAAAWIAANAVMLLGIAAVIALVVVAVIEIVKHWRAIEDGIREVWRDISTFISKTVSEIVSFVKSHIDLLVAIFTGPLGLVVALVVQHWAQIKHWFSEGVQKVGQAVSWFALLPAKFGGWLRSTASRVTGEGEKILRWFFDLPTLVMREVDKLPGLMITSGEHIIESLAHGIESAAGSALSGAMSSVASTIKSFLPFSPAKRGPLSGAGDPSYSGKSIASKVAQGLRAGTPKTAAAAAAMAASVAAATSRMSASHSLSVSSALAASAVSPASGGGGSSAGVTIVVDVHGNTVMSDADADKLANKIGKRIATVRLPASGNKVNIR